MTSVGPFSTAPSPPAVPPSSAASASGHQLATTYSDADRDLALRRYTPILGYLQYENTVYWTRFHIFLLANSGLFALLANSLPFEVKVTWARLYTLMVAALVGLALAVLWRRTLVAARGWIEHWQGILLSLEEAAFADIKVFRDHERTEGRHPIKRLAQSTVRLFLFMWGLALTYVLGVAVTKWMGCTLL